MNEHDSPRGRRSAARNAATGPADNEIRREPPLFSGLLGVELLVIEDFADADAHLDALGLAGPPQQWLPSLWRYSYWAQRRFRRSLGQAIEQDVCPDSGRAARNYEKLINDSIFFESDVRARVEALFSTHQTHRKLGLTAANEIAGRDVDFDDPQPCNEFNGALFRGTLLPVQACLHLAHRARIAILKAAVDFHFAKDRGLLPEVTIRIFDHEMDAGGMQLYGGFTDAVEKMAECPSFARFPAFWQVLVGAWGGFLLTDREDLEFASLAAETGVAQDDIPAALAAFDQLFPGAAPWFAQPEGDTRQVLKLMPAAMRGIGSYSRLLRYAVESYADLGFTDDTTRRMQIDHNTAVRLLDADDAGLVT